MVRRPNSGEAAVVGGDDFFWLFPPARKPLTGGGCQLRQEGPSSEDRLLRIIQLRRANVSRRRKHCGRLYSGEAAVVVGDDFLGVLLRQRIP